MLIEETRNNYLLSTNPALLDMAWIYEAICVRSYWAKGRSRHAQEEANAHSLCFGIYRRTEDRHHETGTQVAFARAVTDYATFGYFADVFVDESERGKGLGKWLVGTMVACMDDFGVRRLLLMTADAHELYRAVAGFEQFPTPERMMTRLRS